MSAAVQCRKIPKSVSFLGYTSLTDIRRSLTLRLDEGGRTSFRSEGLRSKNTDMMSASEGEGGHGKADVVKEIA